MKAFKSRIVIVLVLSLGVSPRIGYSQTPRQFKQHVEALLDKIDRALCEYQKASASDTTFEQDSIALSKLEDANIALSAYLTQVLPKMPQSLTMKFHDERMWVTTSPDHKIRSWAWNTYTGGSMPQIREFVEFQTPSGISIVNPFEDRDGGNDSWINEIKSIQTVSGHTYYLTISGWVGDGLHNGEEVDVYEIEGNKLNTKVPLFKTKKRTLSKISYYSEPETARRNHFKLSPDGKTLLVPLAIHKSAADKENDVVTMTRKSLKYEFDGEHFVYSGVTK